MIDYNDLFNRLLILRTPKIGAVKYNALVQRFGSVAAAAGAVASADVRDSVLREMDTAQKLGIHYICDDMSAYPDNLRAVKNHPPVITARGNIDALSRPIVGIVGTRHATAAGMRLVTDIADAFASRGYAVASGMAIGTDTAAHRGALRARGDAQTIAVLAGGVDYIWPIENESLYWDIVARGVVISEMPIGAVPLANHFVVRNRWIAGVSSKLILGAAKLCSGVSDFFDVQKNDDEKIKNEKNSDSENSILDAIGIIPVSESVLSEIVKKTISEIKAELVVCVKKYLSIHCIYKAQKTAKKTNRCQKINVQILFKNSLQMTIYHLT